MAAPIQMPLLSRTDPIRVNAPPPDKYAVHKLLVYSECPQNMRIRAGKDLIRVAALIEYLAENDAQTQQDIWRDLASRGPGWLSRATEGLSALQKAFPHLNIAALVLSAFWACITCDRAKFVIKIEAACANSTKDGGQFGS